MKRLRERIFNFFEVHLPVFVFFLLLMTVAVQVFARYVLSHPMPKFFELSIYSFVWSIYLGATLAKRYNKHIRFDILNKKFSPKAQLIIDIFFDLFTSVILLILLIPSLQYTIWNYRVKASALRIPWTYLLICFPIFVILILIHNAESIIRNIRLMTGTKLPPQEEPPWQ